MLVERIRVGPAALALAILLSAPSAPAEFRFAEPPETRDDVYLWPGNLHLGYGRIFDAETTKNAFAAGVDLATVAYDTFLIDCVSLRMALHASGGDFFLGTRPAYALYVGEKRVHQFSIGMGAGWGTVGSGFGGRRGNGQLVFAPGIRYAAFGLLGIETAVLLPVTGELGEHYPATLLINLIGAGGVALAPLAM